MKIVICGSLKHLRKMDDIKKQLVALGHTVQLPHKSEYFLKHNDFDETSDPETKNMYIKKHMEKINNADAILVVNEEKNGIQGYIGGNTFLEMGFALRDDVKIFILNPYAPQLPYVEEIAGMLPIVINGDLALLS
jgi:hypothetical protein